MRKALVTVSLGAMGVVIIATLPGLAGPVAAPPVASAANPNPTVLAPNSTPFGKTYGEWSIEFMKWAFSIPLAQNPLWGPEGQSVEISQSGKVWFIPPRIFEPMPRTVESTVDVPAGTALLVNLCAASWINLPELGDAPWTELEVTVDGAPVDDPWQYRVTTPLFTFTGSLGLLDYDPCITGNPQDAVSDGYWIMLKPLKPGEHVLHLRCAVSIPEWTWSFATEVTYSLTVEAEATPSADILPTRSEPLRKSDANGQSSQGNGS
jgi:hypothetical protein